jgi:hypothetical protein
MGEAEYLKNRRQIAIEIESTPGTEETLTAAEATLEAYEIMPAWQHEIEERKPADAYGGKLTGVPGKQVGQISVRVPLKGSGAIGTAPALGKLFRISGMQEDAAKTIAIGAITSGPFTAGEVVTGGTSSGTAMVLRDTATGASTLPILEISGTLQSGETLTGGDSGATADTSGTPTAAQGHVYRRLTEQPPTATVAIYGDGSRKRTYVGAVSTWTFDAEAGKPTFVVFTVTGIDLGESAVAMLSGLTRESTVPNAFKNAGAVFAGYGGAVFSTLGFDRGSEITDAGGNANATNGIGYFRVPDSSPQITANPLSVLEATSGFDTKMRAGTTGRMTARWPSAYAGQDITLGARAVQIVGRAEGDQDKVEATELTMEPVRTSLDADGDRDFFIAFL